MHPEQIKAIIAKQRDFFRTGETLDIKFRIRALSRLKACIKRHETEIFEALHADLGKSSYESYLSEVGLVLEELSYLLKNVRSLSNEREVSASLAQFGGRCYEKPAPYGVALIISPWNYPFLLSVTPLADALAAGNTAILKPSAYAPHTSELLVKLMRWCFGSEGYVSVVAGGREENRALLDEHFDVIFFTGSQAVGREVMTRAAKHLTPVILELGGKSPCIVDKTANLKVAARRIVFGKFLNCGQTCVAPDYILCERSVHDKLLRQLCAQIVKQFGAQPFDRQNYGKIINEKHFDRLLHLIDPQKTAWGGKSDRASLRIEPTILDHVTFDDPVMAEEIFGPILPILVYDRLDDALHEIDLRPQPLALYYFTKHRSKARDVISRCRFGGGCINDTVIHLATSEMGFGGVGESGMGAYHGEAGFRAFSHYKSIVEQKSWPDIPLRYQPYGRLDEKLIRTFL